jgi:hypothetical protein
MGKTRVFPALPDTHAGVELGWLLEQIQSAGAHVVPEDHQHFAPSAGMSEGQGEVRKFFERLAVRFGDFEVESVEMQSEFAVSAVLNTSRGIGHSSWVLAQRPGMGGMLSPYGEPRGGK